MFKLRAVLGGPRTIEISQAALKARNTKRPAEFQNQQAWLVPDSVCEGDGWSRFAVAWRPAGTKAGGSELPLVIVMAAGPEPCHRIAVENAHCPVAKRQAHSPDAFFMIHAFKMQGWVKREVSPEQKSLPGSTFHFWGKGVVGIPKTRQGLRLQSRS